MDVLRKIFGFFRKMFGGIFSPATDYEEIMAKFFNDGIVGVMEPDYTLKVFAPRIVHSPNGNYTTYCIMLQTTSPAFRLSRSKTRRRFSDFVWLRKELNKTDNWSSPPRLNIRRIWNLLDVKFIAERRHQLEQWTHEVLSDPAYLSNTALHLFLQTEMPVKDIIDYLEGRYPADRVEQIWLNQGKLYDYQAHNLLHNSFRQEPVVINFSPSEGGTAVDLEASGRTSLSPINEDEDSSASPHDEAPDNPAKPDKLDHLCPTQPAQSVTFLENQPLAGQRSISPALACGPGVVSVLDRIQREASPDSGFVQEVGDSSSHNAITAESAASMSSSSLTTSTHSTTEGTMTTTNSSVNNEHRKEASSSTATPMYSSFSTLLKKKVSATPKAGKQDLIPSGDSYAIN